MENVFILDPLAVTPYGHNAVVMNYYYEYFQKHKKNCFLFTNKYLPKNVLRVKNVSNFFDFYYYKYFKVDEIVNHSFDDSIYKTYLKNKIKHKIFIQLLKALRLDYILFSSIKEMKKLIIDFGIEKDDILLFPSVNYYSLRSIAKLLKNSYLNNFPKIHFRFINVVEYDSIFSKKNARKCILKDLRNINFKKNKISISAETPIYANYLSKQLNIPVPVTIFPIKKIFFKLKEQDPFTVYIPGVGREDKGFLKLYDIISQFNKISKKKVLFFLQNLLFIKNKAQEEYVNKLQTLPNVTLIESNLPRKQLINKYKESHVILMPYDTLVYQYRGSASLIESLAIGRLVISPEGTGFSSMIQQYGNGILCKNNTDYVNALIKISKKNNHELELTAEKAFMLYERDLYSNLKILNFSNH